MSEQVLKRARVGGPDRDPMVMLQDKATGFTEHDTANLRMIAAAVVEWNHGIYGMPPRDILSVLRRLGCDHEASECVCALADVVAARFDDQEEAEETP